MQQPVVDHGPVVAVAFAFHRLRSGPFEGPATVKPPALPEDTYYSQSSLRSATYPCPLIGSGREVCWREWRRAGDGLAAAADRDHGRADKKYKQDSLEEINVSLPFLFFGNGRVRRSRTPDILAGNFRVKPLHLFLVCFAVWFDCGCGSRLKSFTF